MDFPSNTATRKFPAKVSEAKTDSCAVNNYIVQRPSAGELKWAVTDSVGLGPVKVRGLRNSGNTPSRTLPEADLVFIQK